jgi:hypothetical protein
MPSFTLNGIPISDEQCIGDSLEIINNAFLGLSGNLTLTNSDLTKITNLVRSLSTTNVTTVTNSAFTLQPVHNNSVILCNNASQVIVSIANNATFDLAHKTTFIQVNGGKVVFGALSGANPFSSLNGNTAMAGRYAVATTRYTGQSKGWIVDGDLKPAIEPVTFLTLIAAPSPGAEDVSNEISITGPIADTLYYYGDTMAGGEASYMDIYVNGFYRTTVDFTRERTAGTNPDGSRREAQTFGYSLAGWAGKGPQATAKFIHEDRIDFQIEGGNPVFRNLTASPSPGSEDATFGGNLSITGRKKDTIYYYADVKRTDMTPTYMDVYVNGFYRTTIDFQRGRVGSQFGYKLEESFGGSQATGTFIDGEALGPGNDAVYFTIPGAIIPSATEVTASTSGTENTDLSVSFVAYSNNYEDTIAMFPWPGQSASPLTADIYVDGVLRTKLDFTADRIGDKFWYRLEGVNGPGYSAQGIFAPPAPGQLVARVDLTVSGAPPLPTPTPGPTSTPAPTPRPSATPFPVPTPVPTPGPVTFQLTAKPSVQGGSDDDLNSISIRSIVLDDSYNDTIYYRPITLANMVPADPMDIYVNGVHRTTVDFPEGRKNTSFEYKLAGTTIRGTGIFNAGRVDVSVAAAPTPTPAPTATPQPTPPPLGSWAWSITAGLSGGQQVEDNYYGSGASAAPINLIGPSQPDETLTLASPYINEVLYGNTLATPNNQLGVMVVYVNGDARGNVQFDKARLGTQFGYKASTGSTIYTGTFTDGDVYLTGGGPTPTAAPTPAPTAAPTPAPTSNGGDGLGSWAWSMTAGLSGGQQVDDNYYGSGAATAPVNLNGAGQPDETLTIVSPYENEVFYGNTLATPNNQLGVMVVYVNGDARANINFDKARLGTQFGYKASTGSTIYTGTYIDGDRYLT